MMPDDHPEWTADPPTEPGLYWFALLSSRSVRRHARVFRHRGEMRVDADGGPARVDLMHRVWAGPLREPVGEADHHA